MRKILSFLMTLTLTSCLFENMYNFEEGDLDWINPYEADDLITFDTSNGTDSLFIEQKNIHNSKRRYRNDVTDGWDYHAFAEYIGFFLHNNSISSFYMRIEKRSDGGLDYRVTLNERYSSEIEIKRNMSEPGTFLNDTIIVDETNSEYNKYGPVPDNCECLKWSKKEGLIEYRLRDGTVFPHPVQ